MKHKNLKLIVTIIIGLIAINLLNFAMTGINNQQRIDLAVNSHIKALNTQFNIIDNFHRKDAFAIHNSTQNNQAVIKILSQVAKATPEEKDTLRQKLHELLKYKYKQMELRGVLQYHFVLPDNTTFLRMHKPEKYGDNLEKVRFSFANTNKTHKPTIGFEQGRTAHAFRNVYPIFDNNNKYLCALDIGYGSEVIQNHLTNISHLQTHFIVNKNIFSVKEWERTDLNLKYKQSIEHPEYLFAATDKHGDDQSTHSKHILSPANKTEIVGKINAGLTFGLYFLENHKAIVISFIPIKNIKEKQVVAYLVSYSYDQFINKTLLLNKLARFIFMFLTVIIAYFIYKNIVTNRIVGELNLNLEHKVQQRTKELENQKTIAEDAVTELELLSITDMLTGLHNRRKLDEALQNEFHRTNRSAHHFAMIILDLDHFKYVNDTYGHLVGDKVLVDVASILQQQVRKVDIVGRWGGEEFLIICPNTEAEGILALAEKIRLKIAGHNFPEVGTRTASFGVAIWKPEDTINTLITRADDALYKAKKGGRNRVEF